MNGISTQTMDHVRHLSVEIGHRPTGSPENQAAAEYIEDILQKSGLVVERQPFECSSWDHQGTHLELAGKELEATANWRSLPGDVTGPIVPVGTIELLEQTDLTGRIALLYGELTQDELTPRKSTVYYPPYHKKINNLLDRKKPLGVITVNPMLQSIRQVIKDPLMLTPSATVMPEVGLELLASAGEAVRLKIESSLSSGRAWNILGTRKGIREERVVICAHYDTVWGAPGAYDNASGVSVLLTLAQILAEKDFPLGLEFYAANGEEFGGQGTRAYLKKYGLKEFDFHWDQPIGERSEVWKPILAAINADGVGLALGANNITTIAASKEFSKMVEKIRKRKYPGIIHVDPWPASDQYTFYSHGVPSIAFGCTGGLISHHHQPIDTIQWLSPEKLAEVVSLELELLAALADKTSDWCREP